MIYFSSNTAPIVNVPSGQLSSKIGGPFQPLLCRFSDADYIHIVHLLLWLSSFYNDIFETVKYLTETERRS